MTTRRVVTANDSDGKSYFLHDGPTPGRLDLVLAMIIVATIGEGGSVVRVFTFMPSGQRVELSPEELATAAARFDTGDTMEPENPGMHTTRTIDYGIVLSGEIDLELDSGEVHLTSGDIAVQRGTRHAWRNRSQSPCSIAFVLISSPNYS